MGTDSDYTTKDKMKPLIQQEKCALYKRQKLYESELRKGHRIIMKHDWSIK